MPGFDRLSLPRGCITAAERPAELRQDAEGRWITTAEIPPNATAWFINVQAGELVGSSEYQERPRESALD